MQVDPMEPAMKSPGSKRLKPKYDEPLSNFAFNFNFCRYSTASGGNVAIQAGGSLGGQHEASGGNITLVSGSSAASRHGDITMDANSGSITLSSSIMDIAALAFSLSSSNASMTAADGQMTLVASEHITVAAALGVDGNTTLRSNMGRDLHSSTF
jgi:hypothetical protein